MGDIVLKLKEVNLRNVEEKVNKAVHVYCDRLGLDSFSVEKRVFSDPFPLNFQGGIQVNLRNVDESNREVKIIKAIARIGETVGCDFLVKSHKYISKEWKNGRWVYEYPDENGKGSKRQHEREIAKKSELIVNIAPLEVKNARCFLNTLEEMSLNGQLKCKALEGRKVIFNRFSKKHLFETKGEKRDPKSIYERARLLSFIPKIINKTGLISNVTESKKIKGKKSYEIIGRGLVNKKEIGIKLVLTEQKNDDLLYLSVFSIGEIKKSMTRNHQNIDDSLGFLDNIIVFPKLSCFLLDKSILSKSRESVKRKEAGEEPRYQAQKELISRWNKEAEAATHAAYRYLCFLLDLEPGVKKSLDDLVVDGKLVFDPENGKPLKKKDLDKLIGTVENFLSRKLLEAEKRLILQSSGLGRYIAMAEKNLPRDIVEKMKLDGIRYHGKTFEEMTRTYEDLKRNFEKATDEDAAKLQFIEESIGNQISRLSQETVFGIKKIYYQSVLERKSKQAVRQELFDTFGALNRSWDRIVRTESSNLINRSYIDSNLEVSKKSYFRRIEGSRNTCDFCKEANGTIALYADHPLEDDRIEDPAARIAIWPGKTNVGRTRSEWRIPEGAIHPHCFGTWEKVHDIEIEELTNGIPKTAD